jgi:outer membrane protein OmpA-like peptidoglycan-associated protein
MGWLAAALCLVSGTAAAASDCAQGKQFLAQAQSEANASAAIPLLKKSIAACPSYDAYQSLADLLSHSKNRRDWQSAADCYVKANALAPDKQARAETLFQYASLVNDDGDPQNAYPMIKKAQALDPSRKDIAALATKIEKQIQVPKKSQIERSFGLSVYKPLTASSEGGGGGGPAAADVSGAGHRQVNIPINFQFNSVEPNEDTQDNVKMLADALAEDSFASMQFVFIGHSDSRGDPNYNVELSRKRAEAIRVVVIQIAPALEGRIDVAGRGSSEPIDPGSDAAAMRANRRLQVIVK